MKNDDIKLPPLPKPMVDIAAWLEVSSDAEVARDILNYARAAVEADRQDHLRDAAKMVPSDELRSRADAAYSAYIQQMRSRECLGWEHKVKTRKFGEAELKAHTKAGEFLGRHRAFDECANMLSRYSSGQPAARSADYEATLADHNRLVRELDVLLNGEDGAAQQASLCDIVAQVQREGLRSKWYERHHGQPAASPEPDDMPPLDDRATYPASRIRRLIREDRARRAAPVAQEPVAYLDLGAGGYIDVGTDLTDEQLAALPKGRHMLAIIGTYGVDGYVAAPVAAQPSAQDREDAERYRWLRRHDSRRHATGILVKGILFDGGESAEKIDAIVDAARTAKGADQAQPVEGQCDYLDGDEECREVHEWIMQQDHRGYRKP
ncbi:hypothetical protein [Microvirga sp. 17 mud 1-3]|uniref:hypothetical protein n=1 Tax=Microvirga sp. 17 mud 1-3 TaxID=2082949 RepID=UPI000D6BBF9B|nr:hypothetical protein [Microvirga sp. 17 mud 1-3]AWM87360.1 hypothetical protein C4E04_11860 [Microvirga sp. 17 mud 1-3]